ncbi:MAG: arsenosugar biosynthesis-associated peroxidase-like protein [Acidimicrobiales bacterium]
MSLQERITHLDQRAFDETLGFFQDLGLVTAAERAEVLAMFDPGFPYADVLSVASSVHCHVKVDDVARLPHDRILAEGTHAESCTEGYVKYPFPGGINVIFSSIPISEDDMLTDVPPGPPAVLDHKGIDLRDESPSVRALFDGVPAIAAGRDWRHKGQGGAGQPVYCCHTEVEEKHWVFPNLDDARQSRPIEFAYGDLVIHDAKMGCDLRPIDPAHPRAAEAVAALSVCAASHADDDDAANGNGHGAPGYYERADLGHFGDMGNFAGPMMQRFWTYYNGVFNDDSALTKREKALIALAVSHSKQCPYCIDAFTGVCLDSGATVDQMHEAVHAAAAIGAGIDLMHGVQMQNALKRRGAI